MIQIYRRHYGPCKKRRGDNKCHCPLWAYGVDGKGKLIRRSSFKKLIGFDLRDWQKATNYAREWETDGFAKSEPAARLTVPEVGDAFLTDYCDAKQLAFETKRKYAGDLKQLRVFATNKGIVYFNQLDLARLSEFQATWKDNPLTATKKIERLKKLWSFAVKRKWVPENPVADMDRPQVRPTAKDPFTDSEMERIVEAASAPRHLAFVLASRFSGLRISDLSKLERTSLNANDELVLYTHKTGAPVRVPVPHFVADALRNVKSNNPKYFFWTGYSRITTVTGYWRERLTEIFIKAEVKNGHPHRFRHTFAASLLSQGVSIEDVSILLGHENIRITQKHYAKWIKARQDRLNSEVTRANETFKGMYGLCTAA